jgi:hypothetical protein
MVAARVNEVCRSHQRPPPQKCRHRVPQKNRPQNSPGKDRLLEVGSLGSRRVVANSHARCAAGRHWPCQVAYALWRRAAHRDGPPHDRPPVQSPFHLGSVTLHPLCAGSPPGVRSRFVPSVDRPMFHAVVTILTRKAALRAAWGSPPGSHGLPVVFSSCVRNLNAAVTLLDE